MSKKKKRSITVIKGGSLIDGTGAKQVKNAVVVVEDAKIMAVGKEADVDIPRNVKKTEINADGMTVMPGLIDSHLHLMGLKTDRILEEELIRPHQLGLIKSVFDAADLLDAGFTTVKDCGGFGIYLKRAMAEGTLRGPRILSSGYILSQTAGHGDIHYIPIEFVDARTTKRGMSLLCDGVSECIKAARYALREGADFIKICTSGGVMSMVDRPEHTQFTLEEIKAVVEEARHVGKYVTAHCQGTEAMKNSLKAGVKTIDHAFYPDDEVIEMAKKRKDVVFVPTLSIAWRIITEGEDAGYPLWAVAKGKEVWETMVKNIAKLYKAGLTIASATDFVGSPLLKMGTNAMELELLVKHCGFKPMDAIVVATRNGAKACGLENVTGTVQEGKLADVIVVDGDPLKDVKVLQDKNRIKMVMKEGKIEVRRGAKIS
ncbi:amidohydrolase family protein [Candidatus Bathyarchaeota archaeon]|nr:amidohydrolase family protein [Candidatus Bathyarchaeota archaeon]